MRSSALISHIDTSEGSEAHLPAAGEIYDVYFTSLILTVVTLRSASDAARWIKAVSRHQNEQEYLLSFDKLGVSGMPRAMACAAYHFLSNRIGGKSAESFVQFKALLANAEGDATETDGTADRAILRRKGWRLARGREPAVPELLDHVQHALNHDLARFAHGYSSLCSGLRGRAAGDIGCFQCRQLILRELGNTPDYPIPYAFRMDRYGRGGVRVAPSRSESELLQRALTESSSCVSAV